jgi:hypothetical protein
MKWEKVNEVDVYARHDATQSKGWGKRSINMVQEFRFQCTSPPLVSQWKCSLLGSHSTLLKAPSHGD